MPQQVHISTIAGAHAVRVREMVSVKGTRYEFADGSILIIDGSAWRIIERG